MLMMIVFLTDPPLLSKMFPTAGFQIITEHSADNPPTYSLLTISKALY